MFLIQHIHTHTYTIISHLSIPQRYDQVTFGIKTQFNFLYISVSKHMRIFFTFDYFCRQNVDEHVAKFEVRFRIEKQKFIIGRLENILSCSVFMPRQKSKSETEKMNQKKKKNKNTSKKTQINWTNNKQVYGNKD